MFKKVFLGLMLSAFAVLPFTGEQVAAATQDINAKEDTLAWFGWRGGYGGYYGYRGSYGYPYSSYSYGYPYSSYGYSYPYSGYGYGYGCGYGGCY